MEAFGLIDLTSDKIATARFFNRPCNKFRVEYRTWSVFALTRWFKTHKANAVAERLASKGSTLNKSKCKLNQTQVDLHLEKLGVRCHPNRIENVKKMQESGGCSRLGWWTGLAPSYVPDCIQSTRIPPTRIINIGRHALADRRLITKIHYTGR